MIPEFLDSVFRVVMRMVFTERVLGATGLIVDGKNLQFRKIQEARQHASHKPRRFLGGLTLKNFVDLDHLVAEGGVHCL
jgi:hypothetical protein